MENAENIIKFAFSPEIKKEIAKMAGMWQN